MSTTTRIVVLFNLKPGAVRADYEAWARSTDLPIVNALGSVEAFTVHDCVGLLGGGASPYEYVEILDIADMAAFGEEVKSATMQRVAAEFQAFADPVFIETRAIEAER